MITIKRWTRGERCAREVEAAGCLCRAMFIAGGKDAFTGKWHFGPPDTAERWIVDEHDPRCPIALAAKLRGEDNV